MLQNDRKIKSKNVLKSLESELNDKTLKKYTFHFFAPFFARHAPIITFSTTSGLPQKGNYIYFHLVTLLEFYVVTEK